MCFEKDTKSPQSRMTFAVLCQVEYQSLFRLDVVSSAICWFSPPRARLVKPFYGVSGTFGGACVR